jgi:Resolvase, N terminal domain
MARVSWPHPKSTTAVGETGMVVAAAYLRKSNAEGQTAAELKSTSQQLDEIRKFAASRGWTLDERYVYRDDEVSGEEWVKRPGYQALRAAPSCCSSFAMRMKPCPAALRSKMRTTTAASAGLITRRTALSTPGTRSLV